jgi:hypothetical protein
MSAEENGTHLSGISKICDAGSTTGSSCHATLSRRNEMEEEALGRRRILVILTKPAESTDSRCDPLLESKKTANTPIVLK